MPRTAFPRTGPTTLSNDGSELQFCSTCAFSQACLAQGLDKSRLGALHMLVEHVGPLSAGDYAFRQGDPFVAIAAVRAGTVKPTLPVAFDTRDLEVYTDKGWLRLDAQRNVSELLRTLSPELEARAQSAAYLQLATDAGRKAVSDFVRTWLLSARQVPDAGQARVVVLFPGEVPRLD